MFEARNLRFRYPKGDFVLNNVSLYAQQGEVVGIVGESGSGKSTLSRLLAGLLIPQSGDILLKGQPLSVRRAKERTYFRRSVQMVFQDPDLSFPRHLPVGIPLHDAARLSISERVKRDARITEIFSELKLPTDTAKRRPRELSGGQRQRVAIARAVLVAPSVLILDEPTSALDLSIQNEILNLLEAFRTQGQIAQIMITHDMHLALTFCDRICVMHEGKMVEAETPRAIRARPSHPATKRLIAAIPSGDPARRRLIV